MAKKRTPRDLGWYGRPGMTFGLHFFSICSFVIVFVSYKKGIYQRKRRKSPSSFRLFFCCSSYYRRVQTATSWWRESERERRWHFYLHLTVSRLLIDLIPSVNTKTWTSYQIFIYTYRIWNCKRMREFVCVCMWERERDCDSERKREGATGKLMI